MTQFTTVYNRFLGKITHDSWNHNPIEDTHSYWRLPERYYHTKVAIGVGLNDSDITVLIEQLNIINTSISRSNVFTIRDRNYRQVVDYGDINDYISIQSLVDINASSYPLIEGSRDKIKFRNNDIQYSPIISLGITIQSDPYLYWNIAKNYSIGRILH